MPTNESVDKYYRFLDERTVTVRERLDQLLQSVGRGNKDAIKAAVESLHGAVLDLQSSLTNADRPAWVGTFDSALRAFSPHNNADANYKLLKTLTPLYNKVHHQKVGTY
jgi:hypothetical protein